MEVREGEPSGTREGFRLRASAALFTYNSQALSQDHWSDFVDWVATLDCSKFTATMEESRHSGNADRLHLHLFVEFGRSVDWTSLRPMVWGGITPNCQPTRARGPRWREAVDQGHFYCWADKVGLWLRGFFLVREHGEKGVRFGPCPGWNFECAHFWPCPLGALHSQRSVGRCFVEQSQIVA